MQRIDFKSVWGGLLLSAATVLAVFTAYGLATLPLGEHGGPYVVIGAVMYIGIATLLAVVGVRLIRKSLRERRSR